MASAKITAGLLIPTLESREHVRSVAEATGSISIEVESEQYCTKPGHQSALQFIHARPQIILVDIEDAQAGIASLETLHAALPETRLYAFSKATDPKLIIEAVRAGAREFLPKPIRPGSLSQAIARYVAEQQRMLETGKEGTIYCFTAGKEGSGVTSLAINIASVLAAVPDNRVALLDLDSPSGDAAMYLNVTPQRQIEDPLSAGTRLDSMLLESCMSQADGFSILPAPRRELGTQRAASVDALGELLKIAARTYTHTLIDLPRTMSVEHLKVLVKAAEVVVVVVNPELSSISRTGHLLRHLTTCDISDKIRLVLNRSSNSDQIAPDLIEKALHHQIYFRIPENRAESIKALMSGKPLVKSRRSPLAASYQELAGRLTGIPDSKGRRRYPAGGPQKGTFKTTLASVFTFWKKPRLSQRTATGRQLQRASGTAHHLRLNLRD